jgi:hypothetical protein
MTPKITKSTTRRLKRANGKSDSAGAKPAPKAAQIVSLLQRQNGASIAELMKATGWQAHSVRGFISGTLKRKHGLAVSSTVEEGKDRRYAITGAA